MSLKNRITGNKTLGFKLTLWYSAFFVLSATLLFGLAYVFLNQTLQRDDHRAVKAQLREAHLHYSEGGIPAVTALVKSEFVKSKKFRQKSHFFFRFAQANNNTIKILFSHQWAEFNLAELETIHPEAGQWIKVAPKDRSSNFRLEVISRQLADGTWLQVGMSTESRYRVLSNFLETFLYVLIFLLLTGFLGGYLLSRRALSPIRHLIQTVKSIEKGQMDARVPATATNDELGELVSLFNEMLARIETLIQGMKDSLDNVAHELRTPMTRMHNIAEKALNPRETEQPIEALEDFVEESDRILKMLNSLMDISEAETGVMKLDRTEFRIKDLIEPVAEVYSYVAEEKGLAIRLEINENFSIRADFNRISQVLANLLDNAIKYTPPNNSSIIVRAWQAGSEAITSISDSGKGISETELPKIWDRLYRGGKSRGKGRKGIGLGLAQVQAILKAHNGRVEVASQPDTGSTFTVRLPR